MLRLCLITDNDGHGGCRCHLRPLTKNLNSHKQVLIKGFPLPVKEVAMAVVVNPSKTSALRCSASHVTILHHETCCVDNEHKYLAIDI